MARNTAPVQGQLKNFITDGTPQDVIERYESLPVRAAAGHFGPISLELLIFSGLLP